MRRLLVAVVLVWLCVVQASTQVLPGKIRYVSLSGSDANSCVASEDPATPKRTLDQAVDCLTAGDTLYIRGGTWNERINLQDKGKTGTSAGWMKIAGYPGETVVLQYTDTGSYGAIKARGARGYFLFENLIIDGSNYAVGTVWAIRDGGHHFILRNIEIKNTKTSALYIGGNDIEVTDSYFHHTVSATCDDGSRYYGIYLHDGARVTIERNVFEHNPGGGLQAYPGPLTDIVIAGNHMFHNGSCPGTNHGGLVLGADSGGGAIQNVSVYRNVIHDNGQAGYGGAGTGGNTGGTGHGIRVFNSHPTATLSGVVLHNNTIYNNIGGSTKVAYGIELQGGANNIDVRNNIVLNNEDGQIHDAGTGNTITHNLCKSADSCGTTGKVTVSAITDVTISTSDFRLKQGTNPARNAGTAVSTTPGPVDATDIGAYEQGKVVSAVASDGIDVALTVMTPDIQPTTGITGVQVQCVGCTGSPSADSVSVKAATGTTLHVVVSGIVTPGSCTISLSATNMTDSGPIGGLAQGINSVTALAVTGTCVNSGGLGSPAGAVAYYKLNEGSGQIANDETASNYDALMSTGIQWVTVYSGSGLRFPNDGLFRHLVMPFGASTNMGTASGATCAIVKADPALSQKVIFSSGSNGANQKLYSGWATVTGQVQWGIGIQDSGFSTGSEFPVTSANTSVCLDWEGGTAHLWVNGVKGTQSGKSVKTYTSYVTTPSNFLYGNDGTNVINSGGFDVDEIVFWNPKPADAVLQAYHTDRFAAGTSSACYGESNHQAQLVHLYSGAPVNYGSLGGVVDVVAGGAVAVIYQIDCLGSDGNSIAVVPYYSLSLGGAFALPVPSVLGVEGVALYGSAAGLYLNAGTVSGNLSGALTNVPGSTIYTTGVSPEILLLQNQSKVLRYIYRFGEIAGQVRCIALKQGGGAALSGGVSPAQGACFRIVDRAVGVP